MKNINTIYFHFSIFRLNSLSIVKHKNKDNVLIMEADVLKILHTTTKKILNKTIFFFLFFIITFKINIMKYDIKPICIPDTENK